ncbi:hypothetical protein T265_11725 [Opisthorchis viverrini]|uniref:Uncharacterized protein n=1 Tax=Opisthorchis viverrini TaxID=6198 RepID=A0A074Z206_OPIVI|nr:hypothetical protein T265_11725 [Opisthorchis viverrini]KER19527.1 hypothetical protein T265_11725 [Opisthorchis viverrini]
MMAKLTQPDEIPLNEESKLSAPILKSAPNATLLYSYIPDNCGNRLIGMRDEGDSSVADGTNYNGTTMSLFWRPQKLSIFK